MKSIKILPLIAAVLISGCAKSPSTNYGKLAQMEFDAWVSVHRQAGWEETPLGAWIVEKTDNPAGEALGTVDDYPYMRLSYTVTDLDGTVNTTTEKAVAQRIGTYNQSYYYGPQMTYRGSNGIYAGVEEALDGMHVGGSCKVVVPGWLLTHDRYSSKQKYLDSMTQSAKALIYEFTVTDVVKDVNEWEMGILKATLGDEFAKADSLAEGVYYVCDREPDDETDYEAGNSVYINYICRRMLDGQGVDTNLADSAKVFGIYSASKTYTSTLINWASAAKDITMTSSNSSVVNGFGTALFNMHSHEKGRAYMISAQAYSSSGSGSAIPAYCPLIFEIEFTK